MRSRFLAVLILLVSACAWADSTDRLGATREPVWRASATCTTINFGVLSTGAIIIHAVSVDSAAVNQSGSSILSIYNSTSANTLSNRLSFISTGTQTATNILTNVSGVINLPPNVYNAYFSSGAIVNKQGTAGVCTTVWWDFRTPKTQGKDAFYDVNYPWLP